VSGPSGHGAAPAVVRAVDIELPDVLLVAAHHWDVAGPVAGCAAAFVARPDMRLEGSNSRTSSPTPQRRRSVAECVNRVWIGREAPLSGGVPRSRGSSTEDLRTCSSSGTSAVGAPAQTLRFIWASGTLLASARRCCSSSNSTASAGDERVLAWRVNARAWIGCALVEAADKCGTQTLPDSAKASGATATVARGAGFAPPAKPVPVVAGARWRPSSSPGTTRRRVRARRASPADVRGAPLDRRGQGRP
jgi:hypothetical protein